MAKLFRSERIGGVEMAHFPLPLLEFMWSLTLKSDFRDDDGNWNLSSLRNCMNSHDLNNILKVKVPRYVYSWLSSLA